MIHLHGIGHFHPENEIDNAFLEALDIGTDNEWIVSRVGIENRRTVLPLDYIRETRNADLRAAKEAQLYNNAETGAKAATMALERAGVRPDQIGMVIAGGCSPDYCIPSEGAMVARELGIEVPCFDMHSACSTFGAQLHFLNQLGDSLPEYVLTVLPENSTRIVDFSDRSSAILFGDCSSAAVVSTKTPGGAAISHSSFGGAPSGAMDVLIPRTSHFTQNGSKVQKFAIKRMVQLFRECQEAAPDGRGGEVIYIGHQANLTMLKAVAKRCDVPPERHFHNIVNHGNQAAAGCPATLSQNWDNMKSGDLAALVVVGAGLSWSSLLLEF
jgi:3-oxoacyl-[acyl-carrier-protein] synthase-3